MAADIALERGLPANVDAERFILGTILLDDTYFPQIAGSLEADYFSLEKHRRIFLRMADLHARGERIDRVTVANELQAARQLESTGGITYLTSLDEGLPTLANIDSYVNIVREKSRLRRLIFRARKLADNALLADISARELALGMTQELAGIATADSENRLLAVDEILKAYDGVERFTAPPIDGTTGVATGFLRFDQMTSGLQRGELTVIAARPSMGKTALALNVAQHVAIGSQRLSTAVFSLEMSKEALLGRLLCSAARVDSAKQRAGYLNRDERSRFDAAAERLSGAPLFIDDSASVTVLDIHAKARRLRAERGLDLVVIDYLGLIAGHKQTDNRSRELGEITRYLKLRIAKELNVAVLVLSQLNRAPETRAGSHRPLLSDLRESGDIEQDADLVAFIFREEVYKPDREDLRGAADLIVAKQRNGPTGDVHLVFQREFTRFEDRAAYAEVGA